MRAALFLGLSAEVGNHRQDFDCKFAIAERVASPEYRSCRAGAQRFDDLIFADGLHFSFALPNRNAPVRRRHTWTSISSSAALTNKDRTEWRASTDHLRQVSNF